MPIKATEDWKLALDNDDIVGIMFIDLRKSFDSILITLCYVLAKLLAYGFDDVSMRWFRNYLFNPQVRVVLY